MRRRVRAFAALAAAATTAVLFATAAGGSAEAVSGSFVGKVSGSSAFVALVVGQKGAVVGYVCDSKKIAEWFSGRALSGQITLKSSGGYQLAATLSANKTSGAVTFPGPQGARHAFTARLAHRPAGLYRVQKTIKGKHYLGGWIIRPTKRERGAIRSGAMVTPSFLNPKTFNAIVGGVLVKAGFVDPNSF
jgi:hypothetical protein